MLARSLPLSPLLCLFLLATGCGDGGDGGGGAGGTSPECGNGVVEEGETCDDGDLVPCDGCDENCQPEGTVDLDGFYALEVSTVADGCGFGSGSASTPMAVQELTPSLVRVDVPIGGAGGACNGQEYTRRGNTLERSETSTQLIGLCSVEVEVTVTLCFSADGGVTGTEVDSLTAVGGDCSAIPLPCTVELAVEGALCRDCFSCGAPFGTPPPPRLGPFAVAAGARVPDRERD